MSKKNSFENTALYLTYQLQSSTNVEVQKIQSKSLK